MEHTRKRKITTYQVLGPNGVPIVPIKFATEQAAWSMFDTWKENYKKGFPCIEGVVGYNELKDFCSIVVYEHT